MDDVREDIREFAEHAARHIRLSEMAGFDSLLGILDSLALEPGAETLALLDAGFRDHADEAVLPGDA